MALAYKFWKNSGAYLNSDYPYVGKEEECRNPINKFFEPGDFERWTRLSRDIDQVKERLV